MNMQQATEIVSDAVGTLEPQVAAAITYIVSAWSDKCDVLFLEKERLRGVLENYADAENYERVANAPDVLENSMTMPTWEPAWIEFDKGETARKALEVQGE